MATGDVKNNLRKLMTELKRINYPISELNLKDLSLGRPTAFLPILHFIFLEFSVDLTEFFAKDYELYGKTDLRFVETVYKIMRDTFQYKSPLTREQFLAIGFAERKIIQVCEILKNCREKFSKLVPKASKMEKKQTSKLRAKLYGSEKKEKDAISMKSYLNSNDDRGKANFQQINVVEEPQSKRNNTGKSILKTGKDDDKENRRQSLFTSENAGEKHNSSEEKISRTQTGSKTVKWKENERSAVPKPVLSTENLVSNLNNAPASSLQQITLPQPPKLIPAPVSMTTAPEPTPDLMLTPLTKSKHQAIPLSDSRHCPTKVQNADVSLVDLTDSILVTQPKIVRHNAINKHPLTQHSKVHNNALISHDAGDYHHLQYNAINHHTQNSDNAPSMSESREVQSLRKSVMEIQEKLESVLAMNNEMSARIVLLENKVKFLEGASEKNVCRGRSTKEYLRNSLEKTRSAVAMETNSPETTETNRSVTKEPIRPIVFQSTHPFDRGESQTVNMVTTRPLVTTCAAEYIPQGRMQTNSILNPSHEYKSFTSRRHLLEKFNENQSATPTDDSATYKSQRQSETCFGNEKSSTPVVIEISDDDVELSISNSKTSGVNSPERLDDIQEFEVISPLVTKDIHVTFSDPTTTATILNVERRLKETRAMLANATKVGSK